MLTLEEATTKFKSLLATINTLPPEKKAAVLRLQTAFKAAAAEEKARTQLPLATSLLKEAQRKEAEAKIILDTQFAELQQRKDAAFSKIETEIHALSASARGEYEKVAAQQQAAITAFENAENNYKAACEESKRHPILESDRG